MKTLGCMYSANFIPNHTCIVVINYPLTLPTRVFYLVLRNRIIIFWLLFPGKESCKGEEKKKELDVKFKGEM